jgi:hypothetical protein
MLGISEVVGGFEVISTYERVMADGRILPPAYPQIFELEEEARKVMDSIRQSLVNVDGKWLQSLGVKILPSTDAQRIHSNDSPRPCGKSLLSRMKVVLASVRNTVKNWFARLLGKAAFKGDGLERGANYDFLRLNLEFMRLNLKCNGKVDFNNGEVSFYRLVDCIGGVAAVRTSASDAIFVEQSTTFER